MQGTVSGVILEISQTSRPRDILQIRLGREQEAPLGQGKESSILCRALGELLNYGRLQHLTSRASQRTPTTPIPHSYPPHPHPLLPPPPTCPLPKRLLSNVEGRKLLGARMVLVLSAPTVDTRLYLVPCLDVTETMNRNLDRLIMPLPKAALCQGVCHNKERKLEHQAAR